MNEQVAYVGQTALKLECETEIPVAEIASAVIRYQKPDPACTTGEWPAQVDAEGIIYKSGFLSTDLDVPGNWRIQPVITTTTGKTLRGRTDYLRVKKEFN